MTDRFPFEQLGALAGAALDGAADLIGFLGVDGSVLYANRAACDEVQVTPEQVVGLKIFDVLPTLTPELWAARWSDFRAGGRLRFTDRMRRRDGSLFPVDVHASLVVHDGMEYALVVARDMTERRRADVALRESAEAFRALAENNPSFVARWGRDGRFLYINPSGAALTGTTAEDVIGLRPTELFLGDPDAARAMMDAIDSVFRSGESAHAELRFRDLVLDWRVAPERSERGEVVTVLGVATDVTRLSVLERELRESRDFVSQVISNADEGIVVVDRDLRYLIRNRFMEELSGIPTAEMLGMSVVERDIPQLDELIRYLETALRGETVRSSDIKVQVRPGRPDVWVQTTYSPMRDATGAVTGVIMVVHDVTARRTAEREQRETESRLLTAQKLESLGVLAGGVAHDFNNLLVGILGNASLALLEPGLPEPIRDRLLDIELAAQRSADLTKQMLAYAGRGRLSVVPLDVSALVRESIDLIRAGVPRTVTLDVDLDDALPLVTGDRSQLQQVAMNLVINAGEAVSESGGTVRVVTRVTELAEADAVDAVSGGGELAPGVYVVLEVADTGAGMGQETVARVFEPFFSTKGSGRGLGLSSVLGIVRGHRGALRVESLPGRGTTFRVLLPVSPGAVRRGDDGGERRAQRRIVAGAEPVPVLLVEDEEAVARTVRRMLELSGYAVTVATDGREALGVLAARGDVARAIVLDLAMPGMNGIEMYRELRQLDTEVPVLVTSGYADGADALPLETDPHAAFLAKPYLPQQLADALEALLGTAAPTR